MSGRFGSLRPDSDARKNFWEEHSQEIHSLLEEINNDVFDGRGQFMVAKYYALYRRDPPITDPHYFLNVSYGSIAVCTADTRRLRVIAEDRSGSSRWQSWECEPSMLIEFLKLAIKFIVG